MLKRKDRMIIVFSGLKEGVHHFEFEVTPAFFEQFEYSLIHTAFVKVNVKLEKKTNMLLLDLTFAGEIVTPCDRCTDEMSVAVEGEENIIVKFGNETSDKDEIIFIDENAYEIDLSQQIYEFIHLLLPERNVHKKQSDCNQTVLEKLKKLSVKDNPEESDPRWDALKNLKN